MVTVIPATPPESLACGRGRRHNYNVLVVLFDLFREGSAQCGGKFNFEVVVGKCLVSGSRGRASPAA